MDCTVGMHVAHMRWYECACFRCTGNLSVHSHHAAHLLSTGSTDQGQMAMDML